MNAPLLYFWEWCGEKAVGSSISHTLICEPRSLKKVSYVGLAGPEGVGDILTFYVCQVMLPTHVWLPCPTHSHFYKQA